MNCDQIKLAEAEIISAIKSHSFENELESKYLDFVNQCFAAKRIENILENDIKRLNKWNTDLRNEIRRHKTCIDNLKGYISYLEKENQILEDQLNEE